MEVVIQNPILLIPLIPLPNNSILHPPNMVKFHGVHIRIQANLAKVLRKGVRILKSLVVIFFKLRIEAGVHVKLLVERVLAVFRLRIHPKNHENLFQIYLILIIPIYELQKQLKGLKRVAPSLMLRPKSLNPHVRRNLRQPARELLDVLHDIFDVVNQRKIEF